ncbi:MAG: hypothetical protein PPP58_02265 [Natronomonas sp.]
MRDGSEESYSGIFGAFPYAFRQSESLLFRSYAALGGVFAALLALFFVFALIVVIANTVGGSEGTITFVRSLFVLLGFLVVAPLVAPVLFVARRHRREGSDVRYDAALAGSGYLFVVTLYLGVIASMPPAFELDDETVVRPEPDGLFAPIVETLYAVPEVAALVFPLLGSAVIYLTHRNLR